ncbi:cyclic peptide export ABC transporter [Pseudomonas gingeri]|uniref:cyclic peptide export ABC transporter n=1 Tax=Pseudomonas gingeri TaxID=117681 RepID=UPI0015A06A02|nr:cyclic peptide export ABC transporter [Pseudomonas gingeri]NWA03089.1 cyclic peptide export ABC transporter [Pseudomonas gingeri]NWA17186.1 cyclic peptide export ABC transporter [Pseudomonas gingeri]NWA57950.1 cyclic peptide export ABC transporter [Pseudomonas gingeri]NWA98670.1 cyclic peptide export ABC transporter [Pseudomonas gingeri]NWB02510.1 cyclic peptide export ABC transporter [Pseudomonas gingeri]
MTLQAQSLAQETLRILKPFWLLVALSAALGIVSGLSVTALLATINSAMNALGGPDTHTALLFGGLCLLTLACSTVSNLLTNYVGQRVVAKLRRELAAKVLVAPIEQLERYRAHRLIPVLLNDVGTISSFALSVAPMVISFTVTIGCLSYLAMLSWQILLLTVLTVIIGTGAQFLAHRFGMRSILKARDGEDDLQKHYQAISGGAKELRIQRKRRQHMLDEQIHGTTERICKANIRAANIFVSAETFGSMLFFAVIGIAIAFQALWPTTDKTVLGGFVLVMLYMKGPLEQLINTLPSISRAEIAFRRIAELSWRFSSPEPHLLVSDRAVDPAPLQSIELHQLRYDYPQVEGSQAFHLGPVSLTIQQGEILFIVGENGCGKTTLIKLLLGLYTPQQGEIRLNGKAVSAEGLDDYRQLFTTIFADYYLFDEVTQGSNPLPPESIKYLERLDIAHKVSIRDGSFTTTDLSTGQRKRLALINAWLDQRPVLVFDEWAADQDPAFRRVFYTELLPELKQQGKTIIVISHDDRYFSVADQLVRMQAGQIQVERVERQALPA